GAYGRLFPNPARGARLRTPHAVSIAPSSARKEVENVAESRRRRSIHLGIRAVLAGDREEPLVLHIKDLREDPACGAELVDVEIARAALRACPVLVSHRSSLAFAVGTAWESCSEKRSISRRMASSGKPPRPASVLSSAWLTSSV